MDGLYVPDITDNPHDLEFEITYVNTMLFSLDPASDAYAGQRAYYEDLLKDLHHRLDSLRSSASLHIADSGLYNPQPQPDGHNGVHNTPQAARPKLATSPNAGYPSFLVESPAESSTSGSLKRSLDVSDSKWPSLMNTPGDTPGGTPGDTPATPMSLDFPQNPSRGEMRREYIDLTNLDSDEHDDPFPELTGAFNFGSLNAGLQLDSRPQPADAFNQEWMDPDELAQFLISPMQDIPFSGNGYPMAAPVGSTRRPHQQPQSAIRGVADSDQLRATDNGQSRAIDSSIFRSLEEELFGDIPSTPTSSVTPDAVKHLIDNIKDDALQLEQREPTPSAMRSTLMEHQKIGLTWLLKMERGVNKGGILADEMGLGKTVQALSLILANPSDRPECKTTLIVAPVALMRQWEKELERHVRPGHHLKIYVYHNYGKKGSFDQLRKYDVVLTTFGTLSSEFRLKEKRREAEAAQRQQQDSRYVRQMQDGLALLGPECMWYRVILDEAQCIKNRRTDVSKAANDLMSYHRLCMTGTPMMNSVDELFPLIQFLKIPPYHDWSRFNNDISKPSKANNSYARKRAMHRVQALLKSTMLRRCKTTIVDGKQICEIPPKHTHHQAVTFSDPERELYKAIETHSQIQLNKYLRKGTVNNNYANVLVMLLRLRQVCCHPHLIKDLGVQVSTEGISEDELLERTRKLTENVVTRLLDAEGFECPICYEVDANPTIFIPCGHTCCGECFQKLIDPSRAIREGNEAGGAKCPHCRGRLSSDNITDYRHFCRVFCPAQLRELQGVDAEDSETDSDVDDDESEVDSLDGFISDDVADSEMEDDKNLPETEEVTPGPVSSKGKGKEKAPAATKPTATLAQLKKESLRNKDAKRKYLKRLRKTFTSSAKIEKTVELLTDIQAADPTEKTLVFSQFTSLLDLLEVPLSEKKFKYQRYDGSMHMNDRAEAVNRFMDSAEETVLLISLKAGNAGLNLNKASQVIILDPFWNPFIEDQAIDRAHRMPQKREVHVHRILVPETVEDRICTLQEKKRELINTALDEGVGKRLTRLSVGELQYLFGLRDSA